MNPLKIMMTSRSRKSPNSDKRGTLGFHVLTLFPHLFDCFIKESLVKRAIDSRVIGIRVWNVRDFTDDKHNTADNKPFGGGPGMVLKVGPIYRAISKIKNYLHRSKKRKKTRVVLLSPRGKVFNAKSAKRFSSYDNIVLICGRYEGVDERVARYVADEEVSIGEYTLNGGEIPAMALIEAIARYVPGFLGKYESLEDSRGSYPSYTRPAEFEGIDKRGRRRIWKVPRVLLAGNHGEIEKWRREHENK